MSVWVLDGTSKSITVVMTGAPATTQPDYSSTYIDENGTTSTPGAQDGTLNSTTPVTVVSSPSSGYQRIIKEINIYNADSASVTFYVRYINGGTRILKKVTLLTSEVFTIEANYDSTGAIKTAIASIPVHDHTGAGSGGQLNAGAIFSAGQVPLAHGGTNADLSATGGTGQYLKQSSAAANITVGTIADADLPTTLAGKTLTTPTIASFVNATHNHQNNAGGGTLDAVAIASGTLAVARGGTGLGVGLTFAQGRLCGSATDPIADSSAITTLYYTPFVGGLISVISSGVVKLMTFAATSLSLSGYTANKAYDIWGYDNSGTFALDSTVWTNDTTRATALAWDSTLGDYVKNGDSTRRYLGTIYIDNAGGAVTCTSSVRNIWNRHNQIPMLIDCFIGTRNTTEYTTNSTSFTNVNGNSTLGQGKFGWVVGLAVKAVDLTWALTTLGADTTGVFATAAILLAGTGSGTVSQGVNTANASAGVPSSITIPMFYTPAFGYWTAQKQFKTFSNSARLQENGFIGTFWG